MTRKLRPLHRSVEQRGSTEKGQSLVEMALMLPFLILLLAVVIDAGRLFDAAIVLVNAAREGARFATIQPQYSLDYIQQMVVDDVTGSGTNITHMAEFTKTNVLVDRDTTAVTVTVSYAFDLWFGGIVGLDTITVTREAIMPRYNVEP